MRSLQWVLAVLILSWTLPTDGQAQRERQPVSLYLFEIEGAVSSKELLPLHQLVIRTLENNPIPIKPVIYPLKRALDTFWNSPGACKYPASIAASRKTFPEHIDVPLIESAPFSYATGKIYGRVGEANFRSLTSLSGRNVGAITGSTLEQVAIDAGATVYAAKQESQLFDMLMLNRIDAVIAYHPHFLSTLERRGLQTDKVQFASDLDLVVNRSTIVCHDTAQAREMLEAVNEQLILLRNSGELDQILEPLGAITAPPERLNNG